MEFRFRVIFLLVLIYGVCLGGNTFAQAHQEEYPIPNEDTHILIENVVDHYKPQKVLDYDQARFKMYTEIYNEADTIMCMYTGYKLPLSREDKNPVAHLMKLNPLKSIIAEHSYPKSKGAKSGNARSDMHHLFPVRLGVNVARYNHPFAEVSDNDCKTWFSGSERFRNKPITTLQECSQKGEQTFEPRDSFKGNVARAVFYFYTMYRAEALKADPQFFSLQQETLLKWHKEDPVDDKELNRTYEIAAYQSGKVNPFVIDKTLAERMYKNPQE